MDTLTQSQDAKAWRTEAKKYPAGSLQETICLWYGGILTTQEVLERGYLDGVYRFTVLVGDAK